MYENAFTKVWDDDVEFPSGARGTYFRTRWKAPYGVVVAPSDGVSVLLIQTHRYGEDAPSWEFPKGFGLDGSTPDACARRELKEEAGMTSETLEPLFVVGQGFREYAFRAVVTNLSSATANHAEATEAIGGFKTVSLAGEEALEYAALGVHDPLTSAVLAHLRARAAAQG